MILKLLLAVVFFGCFLNGENEIQKIDSHKFRINIDHSNSLTILKKLNIKLEPKTTYQYISPGYGLTIFCNKDKRYVKCSIIAVFDSDEYYDYSINTKSAAAYLSSEFAKEVYVNLLKHYKERGGTGTSMMKQKVFFHVKGDAPGRYAELGCIRSTYVMERFDCGFHIAGWGK